LYGTPKGKDAARNDWAGGRQKSQEKSGALLLERAEVVL